MEQEVDMKGKLSAFKTALILAAVTLAGGLILTPSVGAARVWVDVGVGVPFPYPYYYPYYAPYYYPSIVYAQPPAIYAPQPAAPAGAPAAQTWYYCNNPQGYYPYVSACPGGWREVPATPH